MARIAAFDRDTVLLGAMNVFWEKGYNGTSMQDLVQATGLNRSSLYNSFGSKLQLYQDTLKHYQKSSGIYFRRALIKANSPLEAIRLIFEAFLPEIINGSIGKGCYMMNCKAEMANQDRDIKNWLLETQEDTLAVFKELIIDGQEEGTINTVQDSTAYAYHIFKRIPRFSHDRNLGKGSKGFATDHR